MVPTSIIESYLDDGTSMTCTGVVTRITPAIINIRVIIITIVGFSRRQFRRRVSPRRDPSI